MINDYALSIINIDSMHYLLVSDAYSELSWPSKLEIFVKTVSKKFAKRSILDVRLGF